jgi:hypothetical protein
LIIPQAFRAFQRLVDKSMDPLNYEDGSNSSGPQVGWFVGDVIELVFDVFLSICEIL